MRRMHFPGIALAMLFSSLVLSLLLSLARAQVKPDLHANHGTKPVAPTPVLSLSGISTPATPNQYRIFTSDEPMLDWRTANDTVRQIGGWRAYAKEAATANAPPSPGSTKDAVKKPSGAKQ